VYSSANTIGELHERICAPYGLRAWRRAATRIEQYRDGYGITDPDAAHGIGPEPRGPSVTFEQRQAWRATHQAIDRAHAYTERARRLERERNDRTAPARPGVEPVGMRAMPSGGARAADAHRGSAPAATTSVPSAEPGDGAMESSLACPRPQR
jgi:hypothetical protein